MAACGKCGKDHSGPAWPEKRMAEICQADFRLEQGIMEAVEALVCQRCGALVLWEYMNRHREKCP